MRSAHKRGTIKTNGQLKQIKEEQIKEEQIKEVQWSEQFSQNGTTWVRIHVRVSHIYGIFFNLLKKNSIKYSSSVEIARKAI